MTKISQLSSIGDSLAIGDQFLIRDIDDAGSPNKSVTVSGITRALADGDATAPALAFAADKNTGIYRAGTDSLAVATNGTARLYIASDGKVGVGTTSPAEILHVNGAANPAINITGTSGSAIIKSSDRDLVYDARFGTHVWRNNGNEQVRIDSSGRLGIGSSAPTVPLDLTVSGGAGDVNAFRIFRNTDTLNNGVSIKFDTNGRTSAVRHIQPGGGVGELCFDTQGTERMRLTSTGLGISTTSPGSLLHLAATGTSTNAEIIIAGTNTNGDPSCQARIGATQDGALTSGALTFSTRLSGTTSERARIDSSGRLLVGSTSNFADANCDDLQVGNTSTSATGLTIGSSTQGQIAFANSGDQRAGLIHYQHTDNSMRFMTNNAANERLRIDGSGRLLVGTSTGIVTGSSVQAALQVVDNSNLSAAFRMNRNDSSGPIIAFGKSRSTSDGGFAVLQSGDELGAIRFAGADGGDLQTQGAAISAFVDGTPSANDLPGRLVFSTTADGASSPTERMRIGNDGTTTLTAAAATAPFIAKISTAEVARIDSSGRLLVGTSTSVATATGQGEAQFFGTQGLHVRRGVNSAAGPQIAFGKTRAITDTAGTIVQSGDILGSIQFAGDDGTDLLSIGAQIKAEVDGTPGANDMPGRLGFFTTPIGTTTPVAALYIRQNGKLESDTTYAATTANAANLHIDSGGFFLRSTSSAKYKTDIETLQDSYSDAILGIRPVWYRSTCENDNPTDSWWGFIAEEVAAIDPRLVQWKTVSVSYDENGAPVQEACDPEPDGVAYERFVPHLLNLIKRQKEQIKAVESRLSALEQS